MPIPHVVPITCEPYGHTATIGRYAGGQFFAAIHGAYRDSDQQIDRERLRWYVYVHLFDTDGHYQRSDITLIGTAPYLRGDLRTQAETTLATVLDRLADRQLADIAIRPFRRVEDGVTFALIDESDPDRGDWAELYPDGLGFCPPWNGDYST